MVRNSIPDGCELCDYCRGNGMTPRFGDARAELEGRPSGEAQCEVCQGRGVLLPDGPLSAWPMEALAFELGHWECVTRIKEHEVSNLQRRLAWQEDQVAIPESFQPAISQTRLKLSCANAERIEALQRASEVSAELAARD